MKKFILISSILLVPILCFGIDISNPYINPATVTRTDTNQTITGVKTFTSSVNVSTITLSNEKTFIFNSGRVGPRSRFYASRISNPEYDYLDILTYTDNQNDIYISQWDYDKYKATIKFAQTSLTLWGNRGDYSTKNMSIDSSNVTLTSLNLISGGYIQLATKTVAELNALTPSAVGQMYYCTDNPGYELAISTGTTQGAWRYK